MNKCDGTGVCLAQTNDLKHYFREISCEYNCQLIKCPNYLFCGELIHPSMFEIHNGKCFNFECE